MKVRRYKCGYEVREEAVEGGGCAYTPNGDCGYEAQGACSTADAKQMAINFAESVS